MRFARGLVGVVCVVVALAAAGSRALGETGGTGGETGGKVGSNAEREAVGSAVPVPAGGTELLPVELGTTWSVREQANGFATVTPLEGTKNGVEVNVGKVPAAWWHVQVKWPTTAPIRKGDVLLAVFEAKAEEVVSELGTGVVEMSVERASEPHDRIGQLTVNPTGQWRRYCLPIRAGKDMGAGELQVGFNLGLQVQRVKLAGVRLVNYGEKVDVGELPQAERTYVGREENAAWREEARKRIEQIRKAELRIEVRGVEGKGVEGGEGVLVEVKQTRSAFGFGTAVVGKVINGTDADSEAYRRVLGEYFNRAVFEGEMKWVDIEQGSAEEQAGRRQGTLRAIEWMRERGIDVRGHCLVWPGWGTRWKYLPEDLREKLKDPEAARKRIRDHILDVAGFFRGRVAEWDVINEPVANHALQDVLGREAMIDWFRWAREADPGARLYLNDYCMLSGGALDEVKIGAFYDNVKFLKEGGAPIGGIGEQAHFGWTLTPPERMLGLLDRFGAFGLPIQITEFDVAVSDEKLQGDYVRDFYTAAFSHPAVSGVVMWGFWEKRHWKPEAALWRKDWSMKPGAQVYSDLVTKTWRTRARVTTDAGGVASVRGFLGSYEITVTGGDGRPRVFTAELPAGGATLRVDLARGTASTRPSARGE